MRMRSIGAAVVVAAALSVTLTGAASAGEPDHDADDRAADAVVVVRCEDGEVVRRAPTEDERRWMRTRVLPAEPARPTVPVRPAEPAWTVPEHGAWVEAGPQGPVRVVPAEPGEPAPVECMPARP
ncbi:hypothetical protein FB558_3286 [Pseudonocardia kunmingensis]|uniref:Secreted protein n=2 Tax=Pseudonocardia kunmingensis TaxID=630975 RepID=A0A543DNA5_9PSEU|nr:hypothetical protein FB558_3286 [Pseudonocardia kunmingensis]